MSIRLREKERKREREREREINKQSVMTVVDSLT